ncbi:hypothetical protein D6745_01280 [Candidatus Woesearchaeota archaeon]|nr:MAG: hypothetical protein D6745_01280 [Candidatus Woesearchaeota archaeon]
MVLEAIVNPYKSRKNPWEMFFVGFGYSTVAIVISLFVFTDFASLVSIFLTAMLCIPLIYNTIRLEEKKGIQAEKKFLLKEHGPTLEYFTFLFFGFIVSFTFWFVTLPPETASSLFSVQINTIEKINNPLTGNFINSSAVVTILLNNLKVLVFCLLFSFFFGFGAIFILAWNASVIGVAIGQYISTSLSEGLFSAVSLGFGKFILHGMPEIIAYFIAGLAGGIISIAVIRHDFGGGKFKKVLVDSVDLILFAVLILLLAAITEVHVSSLV